MYTVGSVKKGKVEQTTSENAGYVIEYGVALLGRHDLRRQMRAASPFITNRDF
jgi:hypothetical protein